MVTSLSDTISSVNKAVAITDFESGKTSKGFKPIGVSVRNYFKFANREIFIALKFVRFKRFKKFINADGVSTISVE